MLHRYLKLMLFSTLLLQASPELFITYGEGLERFQKYCESSKKISLLPAKIKNKCHTYIFKTNQAFKLGYKLDRNVDNYGITENQKNKYLLLLDNLDKRRNHISTLIRSEMRKAEEQNNPKYYYQLIYGFEPELRHLDYKFMKKHKDIFAKNYYYTQLEEKEKKKEKIQHKKEKEKEKEKEKLSLESKQEIIALKEENKLLKEELERLRIALTQAKKNQKHSYKKGINQQQTKSPNCNRAMIYASSSAENAEDYALKGNHKYALIEVKEAIIGTEQALESCKGKVNSEKMAELSKNLSSLYETKKKIENKLSHKNVVSIPNMTDTDMIKNCKAGCSVLCIQDNSCNDSQWIKNCVYSCTH